MKALAEVTPTHNMDFTNINTTPDGNCKWHGDFFGEGCTQCEWEREREQRILFQRCEEMGLAPDYHCLQFADYWQEKEGQRQAMQAAKRIVAGDLKTLMLVGSAKNLGTGTGKTTLAAMILFETHKAGRGLGMYAQASHISRAIKDCMNKDATMSRQGLFQKFLRPRLLVLDEVGTNKLSAMDREFIANLVADRLEAGKQVVLVSNQSSEVLTSTALNKQAVSRIRKSFERIIFDWEDARVMS